LKEWQAMEWLWERLSRSARFVAHFGASGSSWWKERYIFPVLCQEGISYLQQFLFGDWTRAEEESLRHCFHFFAPYAAKNPSLFPQEISRFVSGMCPSFNTEREVFQSRFLGKGGAKSCSWLRDETFARYRARMQSHVRRLPSHRIPEKEESLSIEPQEPLDTFKDETREKAKKRLEEITAIREEIARLSSRIDQDLVKAFPIRKEAEQPVLELKNIKEEVFTFVVLIDGVLMRFSDAVAACISNTDARRLISDVEKTLKRFRSDVSDLRIRSEQLCCSIEEMRNAIIRRLQSLTRVLDHVPMLETTNSFRVHQTRLVKMEREKLKRFRLALTRGPGPEMMLCQLEREIAVVVELAKAFYDEGTEISSMKERLYHFEQHLQQMLSEAQASLQASYLRCLLGEVIEFKKTLEVASDRRLHFGNIVHALNELESQKNMRNVTA
jgi:hypothetical protein